MQQAIVPLHWGVKLCIEVLSSPLFLRVYKFSIKTMNEGTREIKATLSRQKLDRDDKIQVAEAIYTELSILGEFLRTETTIFYFERSSKRLREVASA